MNDNSLESLRKTKKNKFNSATDYYCESNAASLEDDAITKTKKKKRKKDYGSESEVTVKVEKDNDSSSTHDIIHKHLKVESLNDIVSKKIKIEKIIEDNVSNDNYACDPPNCGSKKKKKKKRKEIEASEWSCNGHFNGVETMSINETSSAIEDHKNQNFYDNDEQNASSIKKKKKKKEKVENLNINSNGDIGKIHVKNELQYTESQSSDIDYSTYNDDGSIKKKKKKKHKNKTENALLDDISALKTESEVKVEVKSEVIDFDIKQEDEIIDQESFTYSSTELHVKKEKKRRNHLDYDEVNDHSEINDSITETEKINHGKINDEIGIDVERRKKKKKKNKHKEAIENEVELDSVVEKNNYIEEVDDLESAVKLKKKKKKHKKHSDISEVDAVNEEMDTKNLELIEAQPKKKKKKKYSEELIHEEPEPMYLDIDHEAFDQTNTQEDHFDSHSYKKKKKKHKYQKELNEVENATDCNSPKTTYKKMEKILQEEIDTNNTDKQPSESSGFESDEDDYSESERIPRITKPKPSIFTKYPKLARLIQDSDSDDNYPHLQHRKLSLNEALKLSTLKIQLRHEPLPQHQVEKYPGTTTLTPEEKKLFTEYCPIKNGRFNYDEDQRIVHNWKKFCKVHDWKRSTIYPFLHQQKKGFFYATSVEDRKKFVQFLSKGLPNRTLYSVYTRFRNLYATHKRSRYTKEEDEMIKNNVKDSSGRNRFSAIARKLNRTRPSVWRRYKLLQAKEKENSDNESENKKEERNKSAAKKKK